jgi:geranylgeranyl diphosphate synthase, type I
MTTFVHTPSIHSHEFVAAALAHPPRSSLDIALDDVERLMVDAVVGAVPERAGAMATEHLHSGGKRIRARMALASADALGVPTAAGKSWAAAVELLHNATLVHDDLQDGDTVRRGRPTTWAVHGAAQAINCGDLMLMAPTLAVDQAKGVADDVRYRLTRCLAQRGMACVRGQALDLELRAVLDDPRLDPVERYLRCIAGKTGDLFALPVEGAAILAGIDVHTARAIGEPFAVLGQLFQLQDDVLDLFGDKGRESPGADVREGKVSALVVEHLRLHANERDELLAVLDAPRERTSQADVDHVIDRFGAGGALEQVLQRIVVMATRAHQTPVLKPHPQLQLLVLDLIGLVLRPIQHLFSPLVVGEGAS